MRKYTKIRDAQAAAENLKKKAMKDCSWRKTEFVVKKSGDLWTIVERTTTSFPGSAAPIVRENFV